MFETDFLIMDGIKPHGVKRGFKFLYVKILELYYKLLITFWPPKRTCNKKKYKVSICAIFRDEAIYFREWIEFHKIVGVDHFYLYNNFSEDNYLDVLKPYIENNSVTLIDWPKEHAQISAYEDCIEKYAEDTEWLGFIDLDEFVVPNSTKNIYDFLKTFKNRPAVLIYWQLFGSSGKMNRNIKHLVTEDFCLCWKKYYGMGKCFYNTKYGYTSKKNQLLHHYFWATQKKNGGKLIPCVNEFDKVVVNSMYQCVPSRIKEFPIQINHYHTKSWQEYQIKINRKGDVYFTDNPKNLSYFLGHDTRCEIADYHIYKYMIQLKMALGIEE